MQELPIGIQSIKKLLAHNRHVYIDKTLFAKTLIQKEKHFFFVRPRRFGKSLFLDTLVEILSGNKELFKNCAIASTDYDWKTHPILFLDFSKIYNADPEKLRQSLITRLVLIAQEQDVKVIDQDISIALDTLVSGLHNKYQQKVCVLIDEYDKPITDHIRNLELAQKNREVIREFFATLKALDKHIKLTFVTGITKFARSSLFSGPNHLIDITMKDEFASLMGYTEEEVLTNFQEHIAHVAKERNLSHEKVFQELKQWYNGYRFTSKKVRVFNPYSTLLYFENKIPESYWYQSGTPNFLVEQLSKNIYKNINISRVQVSIVSLGDINSVDAISLPSLLYQAGYLTLAEVYPERRRCVLDFPNREVREAFNMTLVELFSSSNPLDFIDENKQIHQYLYDLDLASFVQTMKRYYAKIPYQIISKVQEGVYHILMLSYLDLLGLKPFAEVSTNQGRIDLFCEDDKQVYVIELKVDKNADLALAQIDRKNYLQRFEGKGKKLVAIGINFDTKTRNISDWKAVLYDAEGEKIKDLRH